MKNQKKFLAKKHIINIILESRTHARNGIWNLENKVIFLQRKFANGIRIPQEAPPVNGDKPYNIARHRRTTGSGWHAF